MKFQDIGRSQTMGKPMTYSWRKEKSDKIKTKKTNDLI